MSDSSSSIDHVLNEERLFPPAAEFSARAVIASVEEYERLYAQAKVDPDGFWGDLARQELHWFEPFKSVLSGTMPDVQWFAGGKTNLAYNCLDANVERGLGDRTAIIWEGEPGDERRLTYRELLQEVSRFSNVLTALGVGVGDVVSIYMPMTPELAIAMLACVRIGAVHSVIFAGFSADAIADRNNDASAKVQLTADGLWRRGKLIELKKTVDDALAKSTTVKHCVVLKRCGNQVPMQAGRDHWWHEISQTVSGDCPALLWTAKRPPLFCTQAARRENPKEFCTRRRATICGSSRHFNGSLTGGPQISIGVRQIAAG